MVPGSVLVSAFFAGSRISGVCSVVSSAVSGSAMDSSGSTVSAIGGSSGIMASVVPFGAGVSADSSCVDCFFALAATFSARVTFAFGSGNASGNTPGA